MPPRDPGRPRAGRESASDLCLLQEAVQTAEQSDQLLGWRAGARPAQEVEREGGRVERDQAAVVGGRAPETAELVDVELRLGRRLRDDRDLSQAQPVARVAVADPVEVDHAAQAAFLDQD